MNNPRDEWIRSRAYALWEQNGRNHGRDQEHWEQAARERDELERVALPGHLSENGITTEEGIPAEYLQADTNEAPAPRMGKAPSAKRQSKNGSTIIGESEEKKTRHNRSSSADGVMTDDDYQTM